jgi:hypothetical protein
MYLEKPDNLSKCPTLMKKLYLSGNNFKKASILLKMISKNLVIFRKASDFLLKPTFL